MKDVWTVVVSTRHTGEEHQGRYATESEAASACLAQKQQFKGCGVHFDVALLPEDMHPDWVPD